MKTITPALGNQLHSAEHSFRRLYLDCAAVRCDDGSPIRIPADLWRPEFWSKFTEGQHRLMPGDIIRIVDEATGSDFEVAVITVARGQGVIMGPFPQPSYEQLIEIQKAAHAEMAAERAARNGAKP